MTVWQSGADYFDGWTGPLANSHFYGLPLGPHHGRQPTLGRQDITRCAVEQQLDTTHIFGVRSRTTEPAIAAKGLPTELSGERHPRAAYRPVSRVGRIAISVDELRVKSTIHGLE